MTDEVKNVVETLKDLITCEDLRMNKCDYTCMFYNNPLVVCQQDKALGFAIQSLESQEGDLINREDAIAFTTEEEVVDHYLKEHEPQPTAPRPITREGLILDAKTGDVMPEWLYDKTTSRWIDGVCEKCGYDMGVDAWSREVHFCPCCGSKMIGETDDKE